MVILQEFQYKPAPSANAITTQIKNSVKTGSALDTKILQ
jgi:hypothetical protein